MDLELYLQVARRHRRLVIAGVAATFALAMLSYVRISPAGIGYRSFQNWSNTATLLLSQPGYPEYRSAVPGVQAPNLATLSSLADLYAAYTTSDAVASVLARKGLIDRADAAEGKLPITASALPSTVNGSPTPLMTITANGTSPAEATKLAIGATDAFIAVLTARQKAANIPPRQRVEVRVVKRAGEPKLVAPRSKTPLITVLLAGLTMTFAAVFIRDNLQRKGNETSARPAAQLVDAKLASAPERVAMESRPEEARQTRSARAEAKAPAADDDATVTPSRWSAEASR